MDFLCGILNHLKRKSKTSLAGTATKKQATKLEESQNSNGRSQQQQQQPLISMQ